jgi:hypothetical protein
MNDVTGHYQPGDEWPATEMEAAEREQKTALLTMLGASAPRPSPEFRERLYQEAWAARRARLGGRQSLWERLGRSVTSHIAGLNVGYHKTNGGYDMKKGIAVLVSLFLVVAALVLVAVPTARADVVAALRRVVLGASTEVRQVESLPGELPPGEYPWQLPEGSYWLVKTDVGNYGANVLSGESNEVTSVSTLAEAEALAGVRPLAPTDLPVGYSLREVRVAPGRWPVFFQFYSGPGADIVIVQTGVGAANGEPAGSSQVSVMSTVTSTVTDGTVEDVTFDGRPAAWIDGRVLKWEADGLAFDVGGLSLDQVTAMAIGRSLR